MCGNKISGTKMNINIRKEMKNSKIGGEMINQMKNKKEKWEDEKKEEGR